MTPEAFAAEFTAGYERTKAFLYFRGARGDEVQEIASWTWARAWEKREQWRAGECKFSSWVCQIAANRLRDARRKQRCRPAILPLNDAFGVFFVSNIEDRLDAEKIEKMLGEHLGGVLHYFCSEERDRKLTSTERVRVWRAKQVARKALGAAA